ncbi:4791_t:CDS:2, partial [Gigaspora margarita]
ISNVKFSKLPPPTNATSTGFLTCHSKIKNLDQETWYSMILFTSILQIISGVFMLIWSFKYEPLNVFILNGVKTSTTLFNKLLAGYVITTSLAVDWALFFQFVRLYLTTKKISRDGYTNLPQHTSDERESEEYDQLNHKHHCHNYVFYLAFAAFWHILGNVIGAFFLIEGLG